MGIEGRAVGARTDRQGIENLAGVGIQDDHRRRVVAGSEKDAILGIERQPAGAAALVIQSISGGDFKRLGVHGGDLVLIFQVDPHMALAVGDGLLRRPAQVERADDRCHPWCR